MKRMFEVVPYEPGTPVHHRLSGKNAVIVKETMVDISIARGIVGPTVEGYVVVNEHNGHEAWPTATIAEGWRPWWKFW